MVVAIILGLVIGILIRHFVTNLPLRTAKLVGYPGELLMNMLKMLIIPLIVSTLISGRYFLDLFLGNFAGIMNFHQNSQLDCAKQILSQTVSGVYTLVNRKTSKFTACR